MSPKSFYASGVLLLSVLLCSCKKEDKCTGGSGGNLTLKISLVHQTHAIINLKNFRDTIYIKYNAKEFPGTDPALYDAVVIGDWPADDVLIPGLHCGDYFIYGVGYESVHGYRVSGGIPFSTDQKEGEKSLTIPVSE